MKIVPSAGIFLLNNLILITFYLYICNMENLLDTIKSFEKILERYKSKLEKDPNSVFYKGLVKNTEEYISELKSLK